MSQVIIYNKGSSHFLCLFCTPHPRRFLKPNFKQEDLHQFIPEMHNKPWMQNARLLRTDRLTVESYTLKN